MSEIIVCNIAYVKRFERSCQTDGRIEVIFLNVHVCILYFPNTTLSSFHLHKHKVPNLSVSNISDTSGKNNDFPSLESEVSEWSSVCRHHFLHALLLIIWEKRKKKCSFNDSGDFISTSCEHLNFHFEVIHYLPAGNTTKANCHHNPIRYQTPSVALEVLSSAES